MLRLLRKLKYGVNYRSLNMEQLETFLKLEKAGIIHRRRVGDTNFFQLNEGVVVSKQDRIFTFEIRPIISLGIAFKYHDCFECVSSNKNSPHNYFLTYFVNPLDPQLEEFAVGSEVRAKVMARGYDNDVEALLLRLPRSEDYEWIRDDKPCLTIGLNDSVLEASNEHLDYNEKIHGTFIEGIKVIMVNDKIYTSHKDFKLKSKVWELLVRGDEGYLFPKEDKKILNKR